jgi:ABC-type lipoprotein release transport system permease subunit
MGWLRRLHKNVLGSPEAADLEDEVRFHIDRRVDDYVSHHFAVVATAFMASWLPARRAAALNPVVALRED